MEKAVDTTANKQAAKVSSRKSVKRASPKKAVGSTRKSANRVSNSDGYGASATRLLSRGRTAVSDAYTWADETGRALPAKARKMHLPDTSAMQHFVADRPLVIGALGLGIGIALGALIPSAQQFGKRTTGKPSRRT